MAEQRFGRIVVTGTDAEIALATEAYANQTQPVSVGDLEPRDYFLEFLTKREFLAAGLVIPGTENRRPKSVTNPKGGIAAYGYTLRGKQVVNSNRSHDEKIYVCRHEPFHPIFSANISKAKAVKLRGLVARNPDGSAYQNRLSEVWCDAMVELFWGQGSILDAYYGDIADADLQSAWDIVMAPEVDPEPVPVDPPTPLPLPDPAFVALQDENSRLHSVLDCIHELSAPA